MRILLAQVPTSHLGSKELVYPIGLARLSSLIPKTYKKYAIDMNLYPDPWPKLKDMLIKYSPDLIALSFRNIDPLAGHQVSYLSSLKTTAKMARLLVPKARIIAGGPAFSLFGKRLMLEIPEIDFGLAGEGELFFAQMISMQFKPENISGLIWRNKKNSIQQNPIEKSSSMDKLPHMDTDAFLPQNYLKENQYVAPFGIEGKRGCDLKCAYCIYPCLGGMRMRLRSPENIVDEIEQLSKTYKIDLFHFTDSVVNRPLEHFNSVCKEIIHRKMDISWTGFFREDTLTHESLDLASSAGLVAVYFSADALYDQGLKVLNKHLSIKDIVKASEITAKTGMLTMCHFLVNLPYETDKHIRQSKDLLNRIIDIHMPAGNLGAVIFNNIRLYSKAPLTKKLIKEKLIDPSTDLLYPVYYNPPKHAHVIHQLQTVCHTAGIFSRLKIGPCFENFAEKKLEKIPNKREK